MAVTAFRALGTLIVVVAAMLVGWWLWQFYTLSPWTRDAQVQANIVSVAPDVSGLITAINVIDNQKVAKGDVLFVIDQARFALAVEQAQADIAQSQWTLKLAQDDADRDAQAQAGDPGAISVQTVETSRAKAGEAAAALQLAQSRLATAQLNLERSTVRSPVNGFVTNLTATVGDYAERATGVLALVDSDSFYVYAYFMETKLPAIKVGSEAEIRLMAGGLVLRGTVQGLSRAIANPTSARGGLLASVDPNFEWIRLAQRIPVRISLKRVPDNVELAAGMSATVVVHPPPDQPDADPAPRRIR
jgi:RND family efflux transporter MFP subunit